MARQNPLTDTDLEQIRRLHGEGKTRNDIARALKRSGSTISKACVDLGLTFDRSTVTMATEARKADAANRRAAIELRMLTEADLLLDELHAPVLVYNFGGKDNTYEEQLHDEPDASSKLKLVQAAGIAVDRAMRLADFDAESGTRQAIGMLGRLAERLGVQSPEPDGT